MRSDARLRTSRHYRDFHPTRMVCAGGGTTDTCDGDSGGPLMVSDGAFPVLAGLTSWGERCATGVPGVYTRLGAPTSTVGARPGADGARHVSEPQPNQAVSFIGTTGKVEMNPLYSPTSPGTSATARRRSTGRTRRTPTRPAGSYIARATADTQDADGDIAVAKVRVNVASPPPPPPPVGGARADTPSRPPRGARGSSPRASRW